MIGAIILVIIVFLLMGVAEQTFSGRSLVVASEDGKTAKTVALKDFESDGWTRALWFGVIVGLINCFAPKTGPLVAFFLLIIMLALYAYMCVRWHYESRGGVLGFVTFVLIALVIHWTTMATAAMATTNLKGGLANFVMTIPSLFLIGSIAFFFLDRIFLYSNEKRRESLNGEGEIVDKEADARANLAKAIGVVIAVLVAFMLLSVLVGGVRTGNFSLSSPFFRAALMNLETTKGDGDNPSDLTKVDLDKEIAEATKQLTVEKITIEELEKLTTEKYKDISRELLLSSLSPKDKERTQSTGFSDALTFGFESSKPSEMISELEEEILRNPIYTATLINAIRDKKIGSKRIGDLNSWMDEFHSLNKENGVAYWIVKYKDDESGALYVSDEFRIYGATLCTFLERLVNQGVYAWQTVENWCLNASVKNNERMGELADYQYTKDALILEYVGKYAVDSDGKSEPGTGLFVIGFNIHDKRPEFYGDTPEEVTPEPEPSPEPSPEPTPSPEPSPEPGPGPGPGPDPTPGVVKDPADDAVNNGNADKGGGDNNDGTVGEYQPTDERNENYSGSENDNNHGYSDPATVTPDTPPVESEYSSDPVVDYEEPMNYETDAPTERGPEDETSKPTTSSGGDGEYDPGEG